MGCTAREKHLRSSRRTARSVTKPEFDPLAYHLSLQDPIRNNKHSPNAKCDENGWGYFTEEQLEDILLTNLGVLYKEAISRLVGLGYEEKTALDAVLRSGHCWGEMDVLNNILHNSLGYLNGNGNAAGGAGDEDLDEFAPTFTDLRQLEEYSLAGMVCLLQEARPHLSKGDALWCLVMSDLHVGRASAIEVPVAHLPGNSSGMVHTGVESVCGNGIDNGVGVVAPAFCRFHGGWGFGHGGSEFDVNGFSSHSSEMTPHRDIEFPKRFNLSPSMKSLLKKNVSMFAAGFRANSKLNVPQTPELVQAGTNVLSGAHVAPLTAGVDHLVERHEESQDPNSKDGVSSMLSKFRDLSINGNSELVGDGQKDEMIATLLLQIQDLERQVKERKEWAHQKAMQAARKLSNDLAELKTLRMEREERQRLEKGKQTLEDSTMKRLSEMENALRKASGQVDRANAAVRKLEIENAEIRAEVEASKLSASESARICLEVAKREKKCLKRLSAWEKQKTKLQEEIAEEKEKFKELQQSLATTQLAHKETELKWKQEVKAKEQAAAQVEEERRSKEAAEANYKRRLESLRLKIEIDFQRHKDDFQRLDQEFSQLKASAESTELGPQQGTTLSEKFEKTKAPGETIARLLDELEDSSDKEGNGDRECMLCKKDEVSIVFLPCAHQVLCASCSDNYGNKCRATCPCCRIPIEQRIRVFGASS